jgi:hypothetical protein
MHMLRDKAKAGIILLKLGARRHQMHLGGLPRIYCLEISQYQSHTGCTGYVSLSTKLFKCFAIWGSMHQCNCAQVIMSFPETHPR